jgi:hypothetical protein
MNHSAQRGREARTIDAEMACESHPLFKLPVFRQKHNLSLEIIVLEVCGGGRGIRTPDTLSGITVFKTVCFNRSHIPPRDWYQQFTSSRKLALKDDQSE